jgi:hypothetical protein
MAPGVAGTASAKPHLATEQRIIPRWPLRPLDVVGRRRFPLTDERLIPFEATRNTGDANNRPRTLHWLLRFARIVGGPNGTSRSSSALPSFTRKLVMKLSGKPSGL